MELDLREAIETGDLDVFYQPIIEAGSGKIFACEALARWDRRGHGFVPPGEFIPLAEETGLIFALGEAVLRKACLAAVEWPRDIDVAVNLSARQFQGGDLVALIAKCLDDSGLPANRLELEITEIGAHRRQVSGAEDLGGAAAVGRSHLARRFRHGVFVALLFVEFSF